MIAEMNRLGMLVDISHASDATFWDEIETTRAPLIASHSCARAVADHPRNLDDAMLRAVAENGGVVMVNFFAMFVDERKTSPLGLAWNWLRDTPLERVVDHIDHIRGVAGIDHVGLGSDFDGAAVVPRGSRGRGRPTQPDARARAARLRRGGRAQGSGREHPARLGGGGAPPLDHILV